MSTAAPLVSLGAALGRAPCALHVTRRASMCVEVLAEVTDGRRAMMELLLT